MKFSIQWCVLTDLCSPDSTHRTVTLVDEDQILHNQWDKSFYRTSTERLEASRGKMAGKRLAHARPKPSRPRHDPTEQKNGTPTHSDGGRDQEVAADTVGEQRKGGKQ